MSTYRILEINGKFYPQVKMSSLWKRFNHWNTWATIYKYSFEDFHRLSYWSLRSRGSLASFGCRTHADAHTKAVLYAKEVSVKNNVEKVVDQWHDKY